VFYGVFGCFNVFLSTFMAVYARRGEFGRYLCCFFRLVPEFNMNDEQLSDSSAEDTPTHPQETQTADEVVIWSSRYFLGEETS
jgi:hypothetical protein